MTLRQTAGALIPELEHYQRRLLIAGAIALALCAIGWVVNPSQFFQSYLLAYLFVLGLTLGCLAFAMVHQLTGGAWGVIVRRSIGAASRTLPVVTLLFLPIVAGISRLYPWANAAVVAHDEVLQWKRPYLNVPFFLVRAAIYFGTWNVISLLLNRLSLEQDVTGDPRIARRMQRIGAGGLVAYGLTITFASFDWVMSIEPHWYSTIFGVLMIGAQGLSGIAFAILTLEWLSRRPPLQDVVTPAYFHDLGNLLLAFVMLWAYFAFSQYLIIWSGNLPDEIEWYQHRLGSGWQVLGLVLILCHFALPFLLLLSRTLKRNRLLLASVAGWVLLLRMVDLFWLTAPAFHPERLAVHVLDVMLPLSLGTLWLGCFVQQLRRRPLLPFHDPEFAEALGPTVARSEHLPSRP